MSTGEPGKTLKQMRKEKAAREKRQAEKAAAQQAKEKENPSTSEKEHPSIHVEAPHLSSPTATIGDNIANQASTSRTPTKTVAMEDIRRSRPLRHEEEAQIQEDEALALSLLHLEEDRVQLEKEDAKTAERLQAAVNDEEDLLTEGEDADDPVVIHVFSYLSTEFQVSLSEPQQGRLISFDYAMELLRTKAELLTHMGKDLDFSHFKGKNRVEAQEEHAKALSRWSNQVEQIVDFLARNIPDTSSMPARGDWAPRFCDTERRLKDVGVDFGAWHQSLMNRQRSMSWRDVTARGLSSARTAPHVHRSHSDPGSPPRRLLMKTYSQEKATAAPQV